MKNPYSASYYRDYYVNPLFTKLGIANLYYLWLSYFCIIRPAMLTHKLKVLDFGCGIGNQVWALRKLGIEAFGIDPSESAKKYSRAPHFCRYERFKKQSRQITKNYC
jgi:2-polyprenyl-3-methyl-5-hydroxy-6-metoxy-1,4-benzoquinol methylase